jgi:S1-C subfamily serine protease
VALDSVLAESPAAGAGLAAGAVVVGIDGTPVRSAAALVAALALRRPGETLRLDLAGGGRVEIVLADRTEARDRLLLPEHLGLSSAQLEPALRAWLGVPESVRGVAVTRAEGAAQAAGLRRGDVIVDVDGTPVRDLMELEAVLAGSAGRDRVTVRFLRDGATVQVELRRPASEEASPTPR